MSGDPAAVAVELGRPQEGERVLDLSGRAGSLALRVASTAASVEALQPDEELLEEGRRLAATLGRSNVYFHAGRPSLLPFDEAQFDLAFWCLGLSRERFPTAALREVGRVLAPDGRLVLQDVTAFGRPTIDLKLWELERARIPDHLLFYTEEQIEVLVAEAGLQVVDRTYSSLTLDFDYWAESVETGPEELVRLKQVFFNLPLEDQDGLDLALADGRISFSYPILSLLVRSAE